MREYTNKDFPGQGFCLDREAVHEKGHYPSNPNSARYEKIVRFATIADTKAGWLVKSKGRWFITEGRKITLLDLENLIDLWIEHYEKLSQEARQRFPLKPIYFLAPAE